MNAGILASYFDHTQLKAFATRKDFEKLCAESRKYGFAMVAINPAPVKLCRELLRGTSVHVGAAVGFPLGQITVAQKKLETQLALEDGADEIDYVINIGALKDRNYDLVAEEMNEIVSVCREQKKVSKVIFENCYLTEEEKHELCAIALDVGPDYIKTSTGFGTGGATFQDVERMVRETRGKIKVKAAGGIRTLADALHYIDLGVSRIGSTASVAIMEEFLKTK